MKQSSKQSDFRLYVSIDVGGTAIKYGILDECGAFIKKASCPTEAKEGGKRIRSHGRGSAAVSYGRDLKKNGRL